MKIEKGIPIPMGAGRKGPPIKYPWPDMEVGDSVFFDGEPKGADAKQGTAARLWGNNHGRKFAARKEGNGVRVWRIE